jgi:hypothetical protein
MRKSLTCAAAILAASLAVASPSARDSAREGWEVLFDGTDLDAWDFNRDRNGWEITPQRELYRARKGGDIYTKKRYCDFVLDLEFKVAKGTNSGVFIRMHSRRNWLHTGIEVQVLDSSHKAEPGKHDTGAIYDVQAPSSNAMKPPGEWNRYTITCDENMITVVLNNKKVNEIDLDKWTEAHKNPDGSKNKFNYAYKDMIREGYIAFQDHGNPVWYRNIRIKQLGSRRPLFTGNERVEDILDKERERQKGAVERRKLERASESERARRATRTAPPAPPSVDKSEVEAERLYKMARQAERFRQRAAAISMYRKIVTEFAQTSYADKAKKRLKALGQ